DGVDNDGDGRIDFPNEPGCDAIEDDDETDPEVLPQCSDGIDNDFDGFADFPADGDCVSAADPEEARPPACRDGLDNDGDGRIDLADPGCRGDPDYFSEFNTAACRDRLDNDEDGATDFPDDPGCTAPTDEDETDPAEPPACHNGVDDDGDGLTDYPEDAESCLFAADESEDDPCARLVTREITGLDRTRGNSDDATNDFNPSCRAPTGPEDVLLWRVAADRPLDGLILDTAESDIDTVLSVRDACPAANELACDDNSGQGADSHIELGPQAPGTELLIFVDSIPGPGGIWRLRMNPLLAQGANCAGPGTWECGPGMACVVGPGGSFCTRAVCDNGRDDDGDGRVDFPADPGCASAADEDETDPPVPPQCANGVDDDEDGLVDFPNDPRCGSAADDSEGPDCANGIDDDGDGSIDYDRDGDGLRGPGADPQCACAADETELAEPACADGCDNDADGFIDLDDPGCQGDPTRNSEFNLPACRDGLDNDGDGYVDYPLDPGCNYRDDLDETDPPEPPACANEVDDDEDGFIDYFGADDGCVAAADPDERRACEQPLPVWPELVQLDGTTRSELPEHTGECGGSANAPDAMFVVLVPYPAVVVAETIGAGFDSVLYARTDCEPVVCASDEPDCPDVQETEIACDNNPGGPLSRIEFDWPGGPIFLVLDGTGTEAGVYHLRVNATYPAGGRCGPEGHVYALCETGFECRPDAEGVPTCQAL
ncbi:MAG: hypothetical protein KC620_03300, partial [Myxococcales bacterium]|nr:hypothetical protein [Myxococcales bacterium]